MGVNGDSLTFVSELDTVLFAEWGNGIFPETNIMKNNDFMKDVGRALSGTEAANLYLMIQEKGLDTVITGTIDTAKDLLKRKETNVIWNQPDNFESIINKLEEIK